LFDYFRRGEVATEVRLLAASAALAPRGSEQLAILVLLAADADPEVRSTAIDTIARIPLESLRACLGRSGVSDGVRAFFAARGVEPGRDSGDERDEPLIDTSSDAEIQPQAVRETDVPGGAGVPAEEIAPERQTLVFQLSRMAVPERLRAAMKGTREMRAILIRDSNRMVAASVLCSPKVTDQEIESFARMANVGEEVLRTIGSHRAWTRNYGVIAALTKNPKTPLAISLTLMARLNERDVGLLSNDRNVPEALRSAARRRTAASASKR
jgi:hypothetical protein